MENQHFSWENQLFLWPFSIANCWSLPKMVFTVKKKTENDSIELPGKVLIICFMFLDGGQECNIKSEVGSICLHALQPHESTISVGCSPCRFAAFTLQFSPLTFIRCNLSLNKNNTLRQSEGNDGKFMDNALFPAIKRWRCLTLFWSFHDGDLMISG